VTSGTAPATLPPSGLAGLDPAWSRLVTVSGLDGVGRTFHLLDNGVADPEVTLLCVHGNPSWSYLWRGMLATAPPGVRVIAIDHLDMGFSERTGTIRRLQDRIDDLGALTDELGMSGPIVTVAHDWGGPISLGWAEGHRDQLAGIVLANTAVHQPAGSPAPRLIRTALLPGVLEQVTVKTTTFVRGAIEMSNPRPSAEVRAAYHAPYRTAARRAAIGTFVADIPLDPDHPSYGALEQVAAGLEDLQDVPVLLLWGPSDPVFSDIYLHDFEARLPHADVHRFIGARHYTPEDADVAGAVHQWVGELGSADPEPLPAGSRDPLWAGLERRREDPDIAVVEMDGDEVGRLLTFAELAGDVEAVAIGLSQAGVEAGDRVALLIPPGIDLTVCLYACWRMGAVVVVADAGLGLRGMGRALASADPAYLIGIPRALAAARAMRWPGVRIAAAPLSDTGRRSLGAWATLDEIRRLGSVGSLPAPPPDDAVAAVVFTSGATGAAKGVVYRHHQAQAQRDALMQIYEIEPDDRLVAAFGPFALYGPAMGICSAVPDIEVTAPGSLTATGLGAAVDAIDATLVFASPAALTNVSATAGELLPRDRDALAGVRLLMSAGAPVSAAVLRRACRVMPNAEAHTPYGMTEVLPVADITLEGIEAAGDRNGVCVGTPIAGVEVAIDPLDELGRPRNEPAPTAGVTGEVCIRAAHVKDRYDRLWVTQHASAQPPGWHRSGDVGHLDADGRLWIEGRLFHVIVGPDGPVTPVGIEHAVESLEQVALAAAVGVGPPGTQQVVVVVVPPDPPRRADLAAGKLADEVRAAVDVDVAAVLVVPALPVDKRHNSKINRTRVAHWAEGVLAGGRIGRL
jgi:acyl-coenzyme A synthetase/AMP-(fatty) acid ligase/pimeloyl-ACP methyl ester carboxylesterase